MSPARSVISLGSINLDLQVRAERFPQQSETVLADGYLRAGGGKAANVALLAARLGVPAQLFGRVGDDPFAEMAMSALREAEVDLAFVRTAPAQATGTSMIVVSADGDKTIVLAANANQCWATGAEEEIVTHLRQAAEGSVLVTDLEIPSAVVRAALRSARARGITTILDPSPATHMEEDLFSLCDYITPNPREAQHLTHIEVDEDGDAVRAGRALLQSGVRNACVKLRDGGAALVTDGFVHTVHPPKVEVVDKTGAGDAFAGGLAVALLQGHDAQSAVEYAVLASSFAVTRYGSQAAYPTRAEFERFIATVRA